MSMCYEVIFCDRCDSEWPTFCLWGDFRYQLPNGGSASLHRELGWCADCDAIVAIEELPSLTMLSGLLAEAVAALAYAQAEGGLERISWWFTKERRQTIRLGGYAFEKLRDVSNQIQLKATRREPSKCLECGSAKNFKLPWQPTGTASRSARYDRPIGVEHPHCGGGLRVRDSGGTSVAFEFVPRLYDPDGNALADNAPS